MPFVEHSETLADIDSVIEELEEWAGARDAVNKKPRRKGRPLDSSPLHRAVKHLRDFRAFLEAV